MRAALAGDAVDERAQVRGVDLEQRTGLAREVVAAPLAEALARGWLLQRADWLRPTGAGFRFLNDLQLLFTGLDASAVAA